MSNAFICEKKLDGLEQISMIWYFSYPWNAKSLANITHGFEVCKRGQAKEMGIVTVQ